MPVCRNPNCDREVIDGWWFCPHCGRDNRTVRGLAVDQRTCDHEFVIEGPCCILCGFDPEYGDPDELRLKRIGYVSATVVMTVVVVGVGYLALVKGGFSGARQESRMWIYFLVAAIGGFGVLVWKTVDLFRRPPTI